MNKVITVSTGATLIPLVAALIGLVFYLLDQKKRRHETWRQFFCYPTAGAAIAMPMIGFKTGVLLSRTTFWFWYYKPIDWLPVVVVTFGNILMMVSLVWLVSVLTRARIGEWGWRITAILIFLFVASDIEPGG
jgi:hypothetical protein